MSTTLYSYWRSSSSWRVRLALNLKNISYEIVPVHLVHDGGEQHTDAFRAINPMGYIPALQIDGLTLTESMPIIEYLEETRPTTPLLPGSAHQRFLARRVAETVNAGIQPIQNLRVLQHVEGELGGKKLDWGRLWIDRGFAGLEQLIVGTAGECCIGDDVTVADIYLVPQVYNANRFGIEMSKFPTIQRVADQLAKRPEFVGAHPDSQPDAPVNA